MAGLDALHQLGVDVLAFRLGQCAIEVFFRPIPGQLERMQYQVNGLVQRCREAMTEIELIAIEFAAGPADIIPQGSQLFGEVRGLH